jgi:flagellar basal body-associated protein FliL
MSNQYSPPVLPDEQPAKKKSPWITVLIIVVVLIVLCCLCVIVFSVVGPALLGPNIGNVFSNIMQSITTPTP